MNFKLLKVWLFMLFFGLALALPGRAAAAPRLYFDPNPADLIEGQETDVSLKIDSETTDVFGIDSVLSYPSSDVEIISITNGGFFSDLSVADNSSGTLEVHAFFSSLFQTKSGAGTVAIIKLKSSKNSGGGSLSFTCSGTGADTQILDANGDNILSCGSLTNGSLSYTTSEIGGNNGNGDPNSCGGTCGSNSNCQESLFCYQGFCRNPSCSAEVDCDCSVATTPQPTAIPTAKPTSSPGNNINSTTPDATALDDFDVQEDPTPSPEETPLAQAEEDKDESRNIFKTVGYIASAIVLIILIYLGVKKLKDRNEPDDPIMPTQPQPPTPLHDVEPPLGQTAPPQQSPPGTPPQQPSQQQPPTTPPQQSPAQPPGAPPLPPKPTTE